MGGRSLQGVLGFHLPVAFGRAVHRSSFHLRRLRTVWPALDGKTDGFQVAQLHGEKILRFAEIVAEIC